MVLTLIFLICSEINFASMVSKLSCGIQRAFDGGNHLALDGQRFAGNARARRRRMAAAAKLRGDFVHIHPVALGTEADAGQFGFDLLKDARDNDRFDGADVVNEPFGVRAFRAGAGEINFLEPKPPDAVAMVRRKRL